MSAACCVVITTVADVERARALAGIMLEQRLAACVQWHPIESRYRWQGVIENASEIQLQAKTTVVAAAALQACIREHHDYDTPEIIVLPIVDGLPEYLAWVRAETG